MRKIYLAAPYSHPDPQVRENRVHQVSRAAAQLMREGNCVFSPLSHSHLIADHIGNHLEHDFWLNQCLPFIEWCDELWVMLLDGWEDSRGIEMEIEAASKAGKTVVMWEDV
jgi:nucleoside 2-deoxyribosyltransferase